MSKVYAPGRVDDLVRDRVAAREVLLVASEETRGTRSERGRREAAAAFRSVARVGVRERDLESGIDASTE